MIRKILLLIDGSLLALSVLLGLGYTYYVANIKYVNHTETVILSDMINLKTDSNQVDITGLNPENIFEKKFTIENLSDKKTTYNLLFNNIYNDYENDLVYELYEGENLVISQTIAPKTGSNSYIKLNVDLDPAQNREYTLKFYIINRNNIDISVYQTKKFSANIEINSLLINSEIKTATNYLLANNNVIEDSSSATNGLIKTLDTNSGQPSYYYKGEVENNYVSFNNELWRIIRINEDGNIRIIRNDSFGVNHQFNTDSKLENSYDYLNSNVKNELDNYFNSNLADFKSMIVEQNYCNTLNVVKSDNYKIAEANKSYNEYTPTLKCSEENKLKIGLITYEEAVLSGLSYGSYNNNNYLVKGNNKNTWTISKAGINSYSKDNYVWRISENGAINEQLVNNSYTSIRPVINLKGSLNITGDGTVNNPYIFKY